MNSIYYIEERLKIAFYDEHLEVRKTVCNVMSMIMVRGGFNAWPDLLQFLTDNLSPNLIAEYQTTINESQHASIVENSILAISIIVEDCTSLFQEDTYVSIIEYMLQPVFNLLAPTNMISTNAIKAHATNTVNMLLITQCASVRQYMQQYTEHLLKLYFDPIVDQQLKLRIIEGLTTMMEFECDIIGANLQPTLQVMIEALKTYDQVLALAASEFLASMIQVWFMLAEQGSEQESATTELVKACLTYLLPELLICSKLADADKRNLIQTKEDDLILERGDGSGGM